MKKNFLRILIIIMICFSTLTFYGCNKNEEYYYDEDKGIWVEGEKGDSTNNKDMTVYVEDLDYCFLELDEDGEIVDADKPIKYRNLRVDTNYFIKIYFNIICNKDNDGKSLFSTAITFNDIDVLNGKMIDVASGNFTDLTFTNAEGNQGKRSIVSFKIPTQKDTAKEIEMLIKLSPVRVGESTITLTFASEDASILGSSSDGFLKTIQIEKVKLESPVLEFDNSSLELSWVHVKNVDYYKIYIDDMPLKNDDGGDFIFEVDNMTAPGSIVYWSNLEALEGVHRVKIIAMSNSNNFNHSDFSNVVQVVI